MALLRGDKCEIPRDAVSITKEEALAYQWKIINNWEKTGEVWALRFAPGILGAFGAATGIFVNNHYRRKLRLGSYGQFSTYLPIVVIPAMFSVLAHKFLIQRSIVLADPLAECPLCVQVRAATFQAGTGAVYPTLLAPFAAFMFATRHFTYRLPSITQEPLEVLKLWRKMTKPLYPTMCAIIAGQALFTMYLTYKESAQSFSLQMKMHKIEQEAEEEMHAVDRLAI